MSAKHMVLVSLALLTALIALVMLISHWSSDPSGNEQLSPIAIPTPLPDTPQPEPSPWIEDNDLPPVPHLTRVCHCVPAYGACVDLLMVKESARLHAVKHDHDLIGRLCADATLEELALRRVLERPERIEMNPRNRLAMADRQAYRERTR